MQAICNGDYKFEPVSPPPADKTHADGQAEYWAGVSDTAKQFVKSCLTIDPSNRPTSDELLNHPWLKDGASTKNVDLLPNVKSAFNAKKTCKPNSALIFQIAQLTLSPKGRTWYGRRSTIPRSDWSQRSRETEVGKRSTGFQG
jgi:calcium/calmodulin-dependent protein kinase I